MSRILTLFVAVLTMAPAAALETGGIRYDVNGRYDGNGIKLGIHIHTSNCRHTPEPVARPQDQGRYELQTVKRWVPGYEERVWVAEQCTTTTEYKNKKNNGKGKKKGHSKQTTKTTTVCEPGHYETRQVAGYYVNEEQWVWVSAPPAPHRHGPVVARR